MHPARLKRLLTPFRVLVAGICNALLIALLGWWWPLPPTAIRIGVLAGDARSQQQAEQYAKYFNQEGLQTHISTLARPKDLAQALRMTGPDALDLALLPAGSIPHGGGRDKNRRRIEAIARVDTQVLWVLSRTGNVNQLEDLKGLRVSLGPKGSASEVLATAMLETVGIGVASLKLIDLDSAQIAPALKADQLDAAVLLASPDAPWLRQILNTPTWRLVNLQHTALLTDLLPYLQVNLLAKGGLAPPAVPAQDTPVLTTPVLLLTRSDLHPALQRLAARAAVGIHQESTLFDRAGTLPSYKRTFEPVARHAVSELRDGAAFSLDLLMPFKWAHWAMRLLLCVLPVIVFGVWAWRRISAYADRAVENWIVRLYGELKFIENDLEQDQLPGIGYRRSLSRLNAISRSMRSFNPPPHMLPRWLLLRQHVDFVAKRMVERLKT